jgi:hypothetical protein
VSTQELLALLRSRFTVSVLGLSYVPAAFRGAALGMALCAVAGHRARTGRPDWLMIDDADAVLSDPDIPPHALDLAGRGCCLVMRSSLGLPDSLAASIDVVIAGSGLSVGD